MLLVCPTIPGPPMASPSVAFLPIAGVDARALVVGLLLTTAAAYAGGASVAFLRLGHRRMQVLLSFTGGILLGVAFLHLLPHATRACRLWRAGTRLEFKKIWFCITAP